MSIYNFETMPNWRIPALFNNDRVTLKLLYICKKLGLEKPFSSVYGSTKTVFSGGRNSIIERKLTEKEIEAYFKAYDDYGVQCYLTFSKWNISEKDLGDEYANIYLKLLNKYKGGVIISSDLLYDYIKTYYPNIIIVASVIKPTFECNDQGSVEYYHNLIKKYDRIVPKPEFILEEKNIIQLKQFADKVELLVNQSCLADCPYAKSHYIYYENSSLTNPNRFILPCLKEKEKLASINHTINLPMKYLKKLQTNGFNNFKLQGRNTYIDEYVDMLGIYIFDPTGTFQAIKRILLSIDGYEPYDIRNLDTFYQKINQELTFYL